MTCLVVCPQSQVPAVLAGARPGWVISALASTSRLPDLSSIAAERRLHLDFSDITELMPDHVLARPGHIDALLAFLERWNRTAPLLIHCYAGVSRSTAVAFIALCFLEPQVPEDEHARRLRTASPTATPNGHLVALADTALARNGRMTSAIVAIGRGVDCFEGNCFRVAIRQLPPCRA